ncbi:SDR family oxidoreductase [Burkholderia multivorans]|uniref:SDR family oxidoreductase n=1 Tax=Burkholderia multivorans TaxID=87883 RepID=UPI0021C1480D|nr:SDR family oxidoreductase [Burkholderia multivorans]
MRLQGKRALVTAAGQGIGRATALRFAREGADVLATDIDEAALARLAADADAGGTRVTTRRLDVTDATAITALAAAEPAFDVLFNCAGYVHHGSILDCDDAAWTFSWQLNVTSMYRLVRALLPAMIAAGGASIVNMASAASSVKGVPNRFVYGTTKAAVIGLTKSIAADFVEQRIAEQARARQVPVDTVRQAFVARQPMGRIGSPDEVAALALYLASDESSFTTGAIHLIDGGWSN